MADTFDFRSMSALLQEKNTNATGAEKVIYFFGKCHCLPANEKKWRPKEDASIVIRLQKHLPKTLKNQMLANNQKKSPEARELEVLTFIGFRLLGSKLFQLSLLRSWTDGLGERNKQLMVHALTLARQHTRPAAPQVKPERLAAKPSALAVQVIEAVFNEEISGVSQTSPLRDITQYIEEYHAL